MEQQRRRGAMPRVIMAMTLALAALPALAVGAAAQPVLGGFQGNWSTIDCADGGGGVDPDCGTWGDGSRITMQVGFGKNPRVAIKDTFATACADAGAGTTKWSGSGTGWYTQDVAPDGAPGPIYLHVILAKAGCGTFASLGDLGRDMAPGDVELVFYHDLGSDTIWFDPDGVNGGLDWQRTN